MLCDFTLFAGNEIHFIHNTDWWWHFAGISDRAPWKSPPSSRRGAGSRLSEDKFESLYSSLTLFGDDCDYVQAGRTKRHRTRWMDKLGMRCASSSINEESESRKPYVVFFIAFCVYYNETQTPRGHSTSIKRHRRVVENISTLAKQCQRTKVYTEIQTGYKNQWVEDKTRWTY